MILKRTLLTMKLFADELAEAISNGLGSGDLTWVAQAAAAGRVAPGQVEVADLSHPQPNGLFDDLGELVGKMSGRDWPPPTGIEQITITKGEQHADPIQYRP
jgi:hypothetical protein